MKKHLIKFILALYVMLMITLMLSDYSSDSSYDQNDFNSSRFPKTMNLHVIE